MINILYNVFNINMKTPSSFFDYKIIYFRKKCQISLFFKAKILIQNNMTNKNSISKKFNKYNIY